ncbi:MAG: hypothetical protein K9H14_07495, partial [Actinomycetia bacterium]|nr:hypothetical protein [Actinomycetes bacterium]
SLASLMLANSKASILISAVFTGLSFSAIFPLLVYIGSRIYKQQVDLLLPVLFISGTAGNALAPYLTSMVSRSSINLSIWVGYLFIFITLLLTVFLYVYRRRI